MNIRGIIIRESLASGKLPALLEEQLTRTYTHYLDGKVPVEILLVTLPQADLPQATFALAHNLHPTGYYAHFIENRSRLYIVFPGCICIATKGDAGSIAVAKVVGRSFSIPDRQMHFELMFEKDHPIAHE